jgi:hypothetical protein
VERKEEPMLAMELIMEHGSLYDLLHDEPMVIKGELSNPSSETIGGKCANAVAPSLYELFPN